jgi:hypothetical protein
MHAACILPLLSMLHATKATWQHAPKWYFRASLPRSCLDASAATAGSCMRPLPIHTHVDCIRSDSQGWLGPCPAHRCISSDTADLYLACCLQHPLHQQAHCRRKRAGKRMRSAIRVPCIVEGWLPIKRWGAVASLLAGSSCFASYSYGRSERIHIDILLYMIIISVHELLWPTNTPEQAIADGAWWCA